MFFSTKTYGHEQGLSATFRQPKAKSHCRFLHGYALSVRLTFSCEKRDEHGWVMDFGGLKPVKEWLQSQFDHTTLIAEDDPELHEFKYMAVRGLIDLRVLKYGVGCEAFAWYIAQFVKEWLYNYPNSISRGLEIHSVEVAEHGGNSAIWQTKGKD